MPRCPARAVWLVAAPLLALACVGPEKPDVTGKVERFDLDSAAVGDAYRIYVRLPPGYEGVGAGARSFPLVLQLDANLPTLEEFAVTAGFASRLEDEGTLPPVVVVGVGTPYDPRAPGRGRMRDFTPTAVAAGEGGAAGTGGAPAFLEFLRVELLPRLERDYRLDGPEHRALFGHSLGGLFALFALSQADLARPLFGGYVAASPSLPWNSGEVLGRLDARLAQSPELSGALLLTVGKLEGPELNVYADALVERLAARAPTGLRVESLRYEADHLGTVSPSFADGLVFMKEQLLGGPR